MKTKSQKQLTLGDLVAAAYENWGAKQAGRMVRLAIHARLVVFPKHSHPSISSPKGKHA